MEKPDDRGRRHNTGGSALLSRVQTIAGKPMVGKR